MQFTRNIFCLLLLATSGHLFADAPVDSLRIALKNSSEDTTRVNILNLLTIQLRGVGKYDTAIRCAMQAKSLAEKTGFKKGLIDALSNLGSIYERESNYTEALKCDSAALLISEQLNDKLAEAIDFENLAGVNFDKEDYKKALQFDSLALITNEQINHKRGIEMDLGNIGNVYASQGSYFKALDYDLKALDIVNEMKDESELPRNLNNIGIIYSCQGNYTKALECYLKSLSLNDKNGKKPDMADNASNIGNIYNVQDNMPKALEYYSMALTIYNQIGDKSSVSVCLGNIGGIYSSHNKFDTGLQYDLKALAISRQIDDKGGIAANLCNIGSIYYRQGNYANSLEYCFNSLTISKQTGDKNIIICSYLNLGQSYVKIKKYGLAHNYLDSALTMSTNIGLKENLKDIYLGLCSLDSATGNYRKAFSDYEYYIASRDSTLNQENIKKMTQLEVGYEYEKKTDSLKAEHDKADIIKTGEIKRKGLITDGAVVIAVLTAILALLYINRQQIKRKKDKMLFEKDLELSEKQKNLLQLEKQKTEDELASARILLEDYVKSLVEKNELLEQFKSDIEGLKTLKSKEIDEQRIEKLDTLHKVTILTEEDWDKFKIYFDQAYKGFFIRLKEKLPDLTQAEIRLICLTKLKLETKQMAGILAVSADTIKKTRYRLRKKLGLSEEDSIDDIAASI